MIPVSDAFRRRCLESHEVVHHIEVSRDQVVWEGHATDGNLTLDSSSKICRTLGLTINEGLPDLIPYLTTDLLLPFGTQVRAWRGLKFADGTEEVVSLGVFVIQKSRTIESGDGLQLLLDCHDLSKRVSDARFERTISITAGTNLGTAIRNVILEVAPWVIFETNFSLVATTPTPAIVFQQGDDAWDAAYKMAFDAGFILCFNVDGRLMLKEIPSANSKDNIAVWEFTEEQGNLLYADKEHTTDKTYNKVIVVGEPTDGSPPVTGIAMDTNPNSPTYVNGPFGVKPYFYKSPFIHTVQQAQNTAALIFLKHLGLQENLHCQGLPMEALEEDDILYIKRYRAGHPIVDANYVLTKMTLPLTNDRAADLIMSERNVGGFSLT